jgi:ribokinase
VPVILNPAPARDLPSSLLRRVSFLTPNETEAELLTGIKVTDDAAAARACAKLRARGVGAVIITLGSRGAFLADGEGERRVAGFKVKAVDTTAAGDVFNGALAVGLAEGKTLHAAVSFANAAGALAVTRRGAQPSAPTRAEIDRLSKDAT